MDTLADIVPRSKIVRIGSAEIVVRELTIGKLPELAAAMVQLKPFLQSNDFVSAIINKPADVCRALGICLGVAPDEVESSIGLSNAIPLMQAVIEVNAFFFTLMIQPSRSPQQKNDDEKLQQNEPQASGELAGANDQPPAG